LVEIVNKSLIEKGEAGRNLPAPLIDRVGTWFRNPKTPSYQRLGAGVGVALLGAAIVKNMLMPGLIPAGTEDVEPVHIPVPVRMPNTGGEQIPGMFSSIPDMSSPVMSQYSMPLMEGNMGYRTPMPAVQMGAGTMQGGQAPMLTGTPFRDSPVAPTILNKNSYNDLQGSVVAPRTAVVSAPQLPGMRPPQPGNNLTADLPAGFNVQRFVDDMGPDVTVRLEESSRESELDILAAIEENNNSWFA